jgi:hypothetical protein
VNVSHNVLVASFVPLDTPQRVCQPPETFFEGSVLSTRNRLVLREQYRRV